MTVIKTAFLALFTSLTTWAPAIADQGEPHYGMGMHMSGSEWHNWVFGPPMVVIYLLALVIIVVLTVKWISSLDQNTAYGPDIAAPQSPLDILQSRFARGDIDKEEFDERRHVLEG